MLLLVWRGVSRGSACVPAPACVRPPPPPPPPPPRRATERKSEIFGAKINSLKVFLAPVQCLSDCQTLSDAVRKWREASSGTEAARFITPIVDADRATVGQQDSIKGS